MSPRVTVVNLSREPQMLEDGTMIGAAGTLDAKRENVVLSESDRRRLVEREVPILLVIEPAPAEEQMRIEAPRDSGETKLERKGK